MKCKISSRVAVAIIFGVLASIGLAYWWHTEPVRKSAAIEKVMADEEKYEGSIPLPPRGPSPLIPGNTPAMKKKWADEHIRSGKTVDSERQPSTKPIPIPSDPPK